MVQCEMCGTETADPTTIKIEGAELDVCDECVSFGTTVETQDTDASTETKYSTSSTGGETSTGTSSSRGSGGRGSDFYDTVDTLAQNYDDRIRRAREQRSLTQAELADALNEKASLIRKVERGETLPSDSLQSKLERHLDVSLTGDDDEDTSEWEADDETGSYTLGDVVERKD